MKRKPYGCKLNSEEIRAFLLLWVGFDSHCKLVFCCPRRRSSYNKFGTAAASGASDDWFHGFGHHGGGGSFGSGFDSGSVGGAGFDGGGGIVSGGWW